LRPKCFEPYYFMKNLSLVLNVVLLVAVSVLYYLHFSGGGKSSPSQVGASGVPTDVRIAFINADTVLKHYEYLKVNTSKMDEKRQKMRADYTNRASGLQSEIAVYQRTVNTMTLGQARAVEEDLQKKQQNLQMYEQTLMQQFSEEEGKLNRDLYERITKYLKKYSEEKGLQVVLKFDPTSDVLYGGQALDISQDVIAGLNQEYQVEKAGGKTKADSTAAK
jgi:outer membrane protein